MTKKLAVLSILILAAPAFAGQAPDLASAMRSARANIEKPYAAAKKKAAAKAAAARAKGVDHHLDHLMCNTARYRDLAISDLDFLIKAGGDVDVFCYPAGSLGKFFGQTPRTPLMMQASYHRLDVVRLLLQQGANPNAKDAKGNTAVSYAADSCASSSHLTQDCLDIIRLLRDAGAK